MEKSAVKRKLSPNQVLPASDLPSCTRKTDAPYLALVSNFVSTYRHKRIALQNPVGATLIVGCLEDTIYSDTDDEVNGWGMFYLPDIVNMQVVGVVEGTSCPCDQLVLMTCEDGNIYAYDEEELHLVASSLDQLRSDGIEFPASKTFYKGEAFKDMTKEDWAEARKGPVGRKLDQEHQNWVKANKYEILNILDLEEKNRVSAGWAAQVPSHSSPPRNVKPALTSGGGDVWSLTDSASPPYRSHSIHRTTTATLSLSASSPVCPAPVRA